MKVPKILFIVVAQFCIPSWSLSQDTWPMDNAHWSFDVSPDVFGAEYMEKFVAGDTLIQGQNCTLVKTQYYESLGGNGSLQTSWSHEQYIYFNGDTVFWYYAEQFQPLICFNLEVGDSWYPIPEDYSEIPASCEVQPIVIAAKSEVEYDGVVYRQITLEESLGDANYIFWNGTFDERIFWTNSDIPQLNGCEEWIAENPFGFELDCYSDIDMSIANAESCFLSTSSNKGLHNAEFLVYPNPIRSGESLNFEREILDVVIYSQDGTQVEKWKIDELDFGKIYLPSGFYILKMNTQSGIEHFSKLIVE